MTPDLYRLVYYSRNLMPGTPAEIAGAIDSVLATSRRRNGAAGVSGALMFNAGCFAQVLEGPQSAIEEVFERIQRDERHSEVMVLDFSAIASRQFPHWSMAFVGRTQEARDLFASVADATGFEERRMQGDRITAILQDLVLQDEQRAA